MELFKEWLEDYFEAVVVVVILTVIMAIVYTLDMKDDAEWRQFSTNHHCHVFGHKAAQTTNNDYISAQVGYHCDDGQEYWR